MLTADELQDDTWNLGMLLPGTPAPEGPVFTQYDGRLVAEDWAGSSMLPMTTPPTAGHGLYGNGSGDGY